MPDFPTYDKLEDVPEPFRAVYAEKDGKFVAAVPDVAGAVATAASERQKAKDEEKARKKAEADLVELRRTIEAKSHGITDEQLKKIQDDVEAKIKPKDEKITELESRLRKITFEDKGKALLLAAGVMPDRIKSAWKDARDYLELTEDGDGFVVKDETGNVTGEKIEAFVGKTFKASHPFYYAGSGASGSGASGSNGSGNGAERTPSGTDAQLDRKRSEVRGAF